MSLRRIEPGAGPHVIAYVHDSSESIAVQQAILDTTMDVTGSIGGDLHDSLGQKLVGVYYATQALEKQIGDCCPKLSDSWSRFETCCRAQLMKRERSPEA